jgi:hypothetical protein
MFSIVSKLLNIDIILDFMDNSPDEVPEGANIQWEVELIDFEKNKVYLKHYHLLDQNLFVKTICCRWPFMKDTLEN